jgi:prophage endopeptidase
VIIPPQARLALAAGALVAAFVGGWTVNGWRGAAAVNEKALQDLKTATDARTLAEGQRDALAARLRASDDLHAAKLQEAQNETNRLRDRVSAGPVRLLVAAKCPAVPDLPQAASAPGVDSGTGAELDPAARSAYFALRDGINAAEGKLAACQGELRERAR